MIIIKLYSLSFSIDDLMTLIYHNSGVQFKYRQELAANSGRGEEFIEHIYMWISKNITFELAFLCDSENDFIDNSIGLPLMTRKDILVKNRFDRPLFNLRNFRKYGINLVRCIKSHPDISMLQKVSPPLYNWFNELPYKEEDNEYAGRSFLIEMP